MKKVLCLLLTVFVVTIACKAQSVNVKQAEEKAMEFISKRSQDNAQARSKEKPSLSLSYTGWDKTNNIPSYYIFDQSGEKGFIIASADECTTPILGYSDTGKWDASKMPESLLALLDDYNKQISEARKETVSTTRAAANYDQSWSIVQPLIKTHWGQGAPYNNLCPVVNGTKCPTGCVATAFAQIMYYHRWPKKGIGSYNYTKNGINNYANFGATTYQWDKMRLEYGPNDKDQDDAIATLMYHCGIAHNMEYAPVESYGYFNWWWDDNKRMSEIVKYFRYANNVWGMYSSDVSELKFATTIYNNLKAGLPVLYNATPDNGASAHVYICDGYGGNGYFHINWGWDGDGDGHFLLTAMNGYNYNRIILYNIMKPHRGDVNGDGSIDLNDLKAIANHILGNTPVGFNTQEADVDGDGKIDIADVVAIINLI